VTQSGRIAHLEALLDRIRARAAAPRELHVNGRAGGAAAEPAAGPPQASHAEPTEPRDLAAIQAAATGAPVHAPSSHEDASMSIQAAATGAPVHAPSSHEGAPPTPSATRSQEPSRDEFAFDSAPPPAEGDAAAAAADDGEPRLAPSAPASAPVLIHGAHDAGEADAVYDVRESRARLVPSSRADAFFEHEDEADELEPADLDGADLEAAIPQRHDTLPPDADADASVEPRSSPAPTSSRRPIAIEQQMSALSSGGAPIPPPPESGRQVAGDDPGDFDGESTGVRHASSFTRAADPLEASLPSSTLPGALADRADFEQTAGVPPAAGGRAADVVHPRLPANADVTGLSAAPRFAPATFSELLDASLSL